MSPKIRFGPKPPILFLKSHRQSPGAFLVGATLAFQIPSENFIARNLTHADSSPCRLMWISTQSHWQPILTLFIVPLWNPPNFANWYIYSDDHISKKNMSNVLPVINRKSHIVHTHQHKFTIKSSSILTASPSLPVASACVYTSIYI